MGWEDELTDPGKRGASEPPADWFSMALPFLVGGIALAAGATVGLAAGFVIGVNQTPANDVAANVVTADDITFARVCAPIREEAESRIGDLNLQIRSLSMDIDDRQQRVAELEAEMDKRADRGRALWKELETTREQLAIALQQKDSLEHEKAELVLALTRTEQKLERTEVALGEQVELTEHYRFESLDHNFERFVHESQLAICERGNRKKLGNCRSTVSGLLIEAKVQNAFRHCVRSGQETPLVRELEKGERVPEFGRFLDEKDGIVKGWYVQLCDPTLPEADTLVADAVLDLRSEF